ncbi:Premnaspirodiene oxygenase [Dichanthelium oligosanthes]|uniref:Premnaspirodiene oxygenase n=1 Tax=Dichanthelium oligosanthes TaxID=888268 RepID=A0A1E5WCP9_9POAL|nr:Premnaspirodiene oxygenase [Dichanthelium oligosanthes]
MAETTPAAYYTLLCLVAGIIVLLNLTKALFSRHGAGLNLPPGPWPLPVIGNMHCLLGALPHHAMRGLARRYGAVMLLRLGHVPTVVVSSAEAAREVLKTHDAVVSDRPLYVTADILSYGGQNIAFAPSGSRHWKELRRLCATELLSPKHVLSFRPIREEEAASLVRNVAASPAVVNISDRIKVLMNDILMRCAIGDTCPMRSEYIAELDEVLKLLAGFNLIDLFPGSWLARTLGAGSLRAAREVHDRVHRIVRAIIQDHASKADNDDGDSVEGGGRRDGILDVLLRLQRDGGLQTVLTTEVVCAVLFDVFAAGSETTATTTIWVMSELVKNHSMMQRAQSEVRQVLQGKTGVEEADIQGRLPYLQMVIKETLRLHPPLPLILPRSCAQQIKIMGYDIPEGATVFVNAWAIGRDEKSWPDANEFKPERFEDGTVDFSGTDFRFLPGGGGRRMCPGLTFGLANIEIALANLLYCFNWKLPNGANASELDMTEAYGITARRKNELILKATPFVPIDQ